MRQEASKYNGRYDFQTGSGGAYRYAFRNKMLDELFPDTIREQVSWDDASVIEEGKKHQSRSMFKYNASSAYKHAIKHGLLDLIFGTTLNTPLCDNDVVYLWKVKGLPVYKVGITSERLGERRIKYVCRKGNLECEISHMVVVDDAKLVERALLSYGRPFSFDEPFSGSTEFRNMTKEEYKECLSLLEKSRSKARTTQLVGGAK